MIRRTLTSLFFTMLALALVATPASAHAQLNTTDPVNGSVLTQSPDQVSLHFGESVEISLGSLEVFEANAHHVDKGSPHHPNGDSHSVSIAVGHLGDGGYVAVWRVISADSHPVHGAFTFQVGNTAANTDSLAHRLLTQGQGNITVGVAYGVVRAVIIGAFIVLLGAVAFMFFIASNAWSRHQFRLVTWMALIVLGLATCIAYLLQGVYAAGLPLSRIFETANIADLASTRFGTATIVRLILLVFFAIALTFCGLVRDRLREALHGILAIALTLTLTLAGHAGTGRWIPLAIVLDVTHVLAASAWAGGLIILVALWRSESPESLAILLSKFSRFAYCCVMVIIVTGSLQGWRQLGSIDALVHTDYGKLLLIKVAIVATMVFFGWRARKILAKVTRMRTSVRIESSLAIAVFAVTALLMNAAPNAAAGNKPFSGEVAIGNDLVDVIVDPARAGTNAVHLYVLSDIGVPTEVPEVTVSLTLPSRKIGPIPVPLLRLAPGHYEAAGFAVPIAGDWRMDVSVRSSDIDVATKSLTVPIG